jgi:hypothetical protein
MELRATSVAPHDGHVRNIWPVRRNYSASTRPSAPPAAISGVAEAVKLTTVRQLKEVSLGRRSDLHEYAPAVELIAYCVRAGPGSPHTIERRGSNRVSLKRSRQAMG